MDLFAQVNMDPKTHRDIVWQSETLKCVLGIRLLMCIFTDMKDSGWERRYRPHRGAAYPGKLSAFSTLLSAIRLQNYHLLLSWCPDDEVHLSPFRSRLVEPNALEVYARIFVRGRLSRVLPRPESRYLQLWRSPSLWTLVGIMDLRDPLDKPNFVWPDG